MAGQEQPFLPAACFSILRYPSCPLHQTALRWGSLNTQGSGRVSVLAWSGWKVGLTHRLLSSIKTDYKCCKWAALFFVAHSRPFSFLFLFFFRVGGDSTFYCLSLRNTKCYVSVLNIGISSNQLALPAAAPASHRWLQGALMGVLMKFQSRTGCSKRGVYKAHSGPWSLWVDFPLFCSLPYPQIKAPKVQPKSSCFHAARVLRNCFQVCSEWRPPACASGLSCSSYCCFYCVCLAESDHVPQKGLGWGRRLGPPK